MCALCGVLRNEHWADAGRRAAGPRDPRPRCSSGSSPASGSASASGRGSTSSRDGKGRAEVADDLAGLWVAAERLAGRPLDPLDPVLLDAS